MKASFWTFSLPFIPFEGLPACGVTVGQVRQLITQRALGGPTPGCRGGEKGWAEMDGGFGDEEEGGQERNK